MNIYTKDIAEGVHLSAYKTDKFKSALMTVSFALPLEAETASGYSLLTNLLSLSTGDYPTMQSFSVIKDELYALGLDAYVQRRGELLLVTLEINSIADSFAFDGDRVLYEATKLLGGAIFNPCLEKGVFPKENVESEKKCLIEEIASAIENKPGYAMRRAKQILCENEPFAVDAGGEIDRVKGLDGKELMKYYENIIENAPVYIVYSGEADFQYIEECINAHLPFKPRKATLPLPTVHKARGKILRVKEEMRIEQSILNLGFTLEMPWGAKKRAILSVYDEIFGGSATSKLFMNVREKEGLCYYCSSYPSGRKNVMFVSCGLEKGYEEKAINAIYKEIEAMKKGDFTDLELKNAKQSILRSMENVSASLGALNGYMLGQALLDDGVSFEENLALVESVTREEVIALAQTVTPELEYILGE
ncbi:MAG: insulinase family protein [Ruminococcaceae bacterium]|nr:insulinase family protein [Oscillospiraceae bacterium]